MKEVEEILKYQRREIRGYILDVTFELGPENSHVWIQVSREGGIATDIIGMWVREKAA